VFPSHPGKPLIPEQKEIIVKLKYFFDKHKSEFNSKKLSVQLVADSLQIGLATVNRVLAAYQKDNNSIYNEIPEKGRPQYAIDAAIQEKVRTYVRESNLEGKQITLEKIRDFLSQEEENNVDFSLATLGRTLDRWGFEFGKGTRTHHLKEKDYVVAARRRYLRQIRNNRVNNSHENSHKTEVYLDESYVNKNHSNDFVWYFREDGPSIYKPTGNGERLIIMNAITKNGWVPNAKNIFKSTRKTGDYHGQMNGEMFKKWFSEKLLPNIPKNSLIIMDNAAYHNILSQNSPPLETSSKSKIFKWLEKNNVNCKEDSLKVELVEILKKFNIAPIYELDEIAAQAGHEILRTPQYHPELQPIEICWGVVKNQVSRNCNFTMKNLEKQLDNAFNAVTKEICMKIISKVKKIEDEFWRTDELFEEESQNSP
jgi:transposase